jgi:putative pyoverdin transport system ATP-binding/permease protein
MRLNRLVMREIPENLRSLAINSALAGLATTALMRLVDVAAEGAAKGETSTRQALMFILAAMLFSITQGYVFVTESVDVERLVNTLRTRLFDAVREADLVTVERIGRARLHGALANDTQTIAHNLQFLMIGAQQVILLVVLGAYLAWLSLTAFLLAFGFAAVALSVRYVRVQMLGKQLAAAGAAELKVFGGLSDMLNGFKEVRMSERRAKGLLADLGRWSGEAGEIKSRTKAQWGFEFALMQAAFYVLIGLMVFVVPMFATNYSEVVVPATIAMLFIVGPIGTLAHVSPMLTETELALANIEDIHDELARAASPAMQPAPEPLPAPRSIALDAAEFAYTDSAGRPVFTVGPLSMTFRAGEIVFVTGGNGSGKSTMLRLLTGLAPLAGGRILADGDPVSPGQMQSYRDKFSAIFSDYHLSRRIYGVPDIDPARADALLSKLEMSDKVHVQNGAFSTIALSAGQRKRLALLVAEFEDKPILVFDEWAAEQDPHFRRVFYDRLLPSFRARGKIVLCITHDDRWFHIADRIYHMSEGRVREAEAQDATHV